MRDSQIIFWQRGNTSKMTNRFLVSPNANNSNNVFNVNSNGNVNNNNVNNTNNGVVPAL